MQIDLNININVNFPTIKNPAKNLQLIRHLKTGIELIKIPAGSFMMGLTGYDDERSIHEVHLPEFYMGRYPVTNEEYGRFMEANPGVTEPEYWGDRKFNQARQPVVGVSWYDAVKYAKWAGLKLPTEAQWEYACRTGTNTKYYTGDTEADLDRAGWYGEDYSIGSTHPVGEKEPNEWGLYDMHGNVREWCQDWYGGYPSGSVTDPVGPPKGSRRVLRGGSWSNNPDSLRCAYRNRYYPDYRNSNVGFRVVCLPGGDQC